MEELEMKVYRVSSSLEEKDANLVLVDDLKHFSQYSFNGKKQVDWKPVRFQWNLKKEKAGSSLIYNDFVYVFGAGMNMALNQKAKELIENSLGEKAQFLPITILGENSTNWYLINITNIIESALDNDKSEFKTLRSGNRGPMTKAVFNSEEIPDNTVFIIPESPEKFMLKGDFLEKIIKDNSLTGLSFKLCQTDINYPSEAS